MGQKVGKSGDTHHGSPFEVVWTWHRQQGAVYMKLRRNDCDVLYPLSVLSGKLRLSGLADRDASTIIDDVSTRAGKCESWKEEDLLNATEESLKHYSPEIMQNFRLLQKYDELRGESKALPGIVLVLEGASATGKSMLALELVRDLAATRFISTDTIRQILRGISINQSCPELYCHTYQACGYRQSGDASLDPIVRGYIAQTELIVPHVEDLVRRLLDEGANALIEGVHLIPGTFRASDTSILEVLINPSKETHRIMFLGKHLEGKLRTVSSDVSIRNEEFEAARQIQNYMITCALENGVPVIPLESYEAARIEISKLVIKLVRKLIDNHD
jgi:2-phosphoglycerate kinase